MFSKLQKMAGFLGKVVAAVISAELAGGSGPAKLNHAMGELEADQTGLTLDLAPEGLEVDPIELAEAIKKVIEAVVLILNLVGVFRK